MSIHISELRPDDYQDVVALWLESVGDAAAVEVLVEDDYAGHHFDSVRSLVARDDGKLVAAILCQRNAKHGYIHHLAMLDAVKDTGLVKQLIDKALLKLNAKGVHRCRLQFAIQPGTGAFWEAVRWADFADVTGNRTDQPQPADNPA